MASEHSEQIVVARWLKKRGIHFIHIPNGMWRQKRQAAILKAMGVKKGFPDILIFDRPPARPGYVGVALEMKRARGGRLSAEQEQWLAILRFLGWYTDAPAGADAARQVLEELGFDTP